jgi:alkylhydroperoxidase family enzyme
VLGDDLVKSVLDDWRTAPIDEKLRAMLGFLEKLTLTPPAVSGEDVHWLHAAGVSNEAIETAIYICAFFNLIDRVADALDVHVPPAEALASRAGMMLARGYQFSSLPQLS